MKKTNPIYQVTAGNPKKLKKPVIWTVVTNINLFSFMFLALFVITIYSFFAGMPVRWILRPYGFHGEAF